MAQRYYRRSTYRRKRENGILKALGISEMLKDIKNFSNDVGLSWLIKGQIRRSREKRKQWNGEVKPISQCVKDWIKGEMNK